LKNYHIFKSCFEYRSLIDILQEYSIALEREVPAGMP
jgi:hypothetical protein